MKHIRLLAFSLAGLIAAGSAMADDFKKALVQEGQLTIATTGNAPPLTLVQSDGSLGGFDVALCGRIAEDLGLKAEFVRVDFAATIPGLKAGRFDMICSAVARTPARMASPDLYLSEPTVENFTTLVVPKDSAITAVDQGRGHRIGVVRGGQEGPILEKIFEGDVTVTTYPGIAEEMLDLKNGRVDAVSMNYLTARYHARGEEGVTVLEPGFVVENVSPYTHGLVVSRNEPDLLAAVNDALAKLKADGTIDKLKETWITGK